MIERTLVCVECGARAGLKGKRFPPRFQLRCGRCGGRFEIESKVQAARADRPITVALLVDATGVPLCSKCGREPAALPLPIGASCIELTDPRQVQQDEP